MARFLVFGGGGRLAHAIGQYLMHHLPHNSFFHPSKDCCDITRKDHIDTSMLIQPDIVINCAGLLPPLTETNPDLAKEVNTYGAIRVAAACKDHNTRLIHISTDAVFDGKVPHAPYKEEDEVGNPANEYAFTKHLAEIVIRHTLPSTALILRVPFRHHGPWPHPQAFTDVHRSSRWVDEVAPEIVQAALMTDLSGVLHMGGVRRSVFDMAREVSPSVNPWRLAEFKDFKVPQDLTLDSSKWERIKKERGL